MRRPITSVAALLVFACLASPAGHAPVSAQSAVDAIARVTALPLDVTVVDRTGRVPDDLGPDDFTVSVDGSARRVLWARYVSRGPGSLGEATLRAETKQGATTFGAEPARTVLVLIDQTTMRRGSERSAIAAVNAFVDRLGLDDRLAVVHLPLRPDSLIELTTDRPGAREIVRQTASRATTAGGADVDDPFARQQDDPNRAAAVDPDRTGDPDRAVPPEIERQLSQPDAPPSEAGLDPSLRGGALTGLHDLLTAIGKMPGRKVVAVFSAGVHGVSRADAQRTAALAAAAHAVVYGFGLEAARGPNGQMPDTGPLDAVATATGGRFLRLDRKPERTVDDVMPELSACYVLGIEDASSGDGNRVRAVRVSVARKGLTLRAPAWLTRTPPVDDVVPASPPPPAATPPSDQPTSRPEAPSVSADRKAAEEAARDQDLRRALARMAAYVESYVREYAALVAEEDYSQNAGSGSSRMSRRLRSDVLLVRPGDADAWMCFRDVFEVNGQTQRDREERLKRLFLDSSLKAREQLQAIKDESARLNIGPVVRNLNVPLFPLVVLERDNLQRFRFKFGKRQESDGVERWRIDYEELIRPTLVTTTNDEDVPITGSFLIDPMTGAVIESRLLADTERGRAELTVKFRRDPDLGFWVPAEMTEFYRSRSYVTLADGRATYSNFRRFQVKTEQTITVPK